MFSIARKVSPLALALMIGCGSSAKPGYLTFPNSSTQKIPDGGRLNMPSPFQSKGYLVVSNGTLAIDGISFGKISPTDTVVIKGPHEVIVNGSPRQESPVANERDLRWGPEPPNPVGP